MQLGDRPGVHSDPDIERICPVCHPELLREKKLQEAFERIKQPSTLQLLQGPRQFIDDHGWVGWRGPK